MLAWSWALRILNILLVATLIVPGVSFAKDLNGHQFDACDDGALNFLPNQNSHYPELKKLTARSRVIWERAMETMASRMGGFFRDHYRLYKQMSLSGHPIIDKYVEARFYLDRQEFSARFKNAGERAANLLLYFKHKGEELVKSGAITEADLIKPGLFFVDTKGEIQILEYAEEIPDDWHFATDAEVATILTGPKYRRLLARGYQAVQVQQDDHREVGYWIAPHDIAHLFGYYSDPGYMRSVSKFSRFITDDLEQMGRGNIDVKTAGRAFYVFEQLVHPNLAVLTDYFKKIGAPEGMNCHTLECVKAILAKDPEKTTSLYDAIRLRFFKPLGGVAMSLNPADMDHIAVSDFAPFYAVLKEDTPDRVAGVLFFLIQLSQMSPEEHVTRMASGPDERLCAAYSPFFAAAPPRFREMLCGPNH